MQNKTSNIIDQISNQIRISEFIGQYVTLSQRGANFLGLCPFHSEKSPSFTINNDKKFFHCFGCKESGNVIQFAMKYHNIDFKEALQNVANYAGITLDQNTQKKLSARELLIKQLIDLNGQVALTYHKEIKNQNSLALQYLHKRKIQDTSISQFLLGNSPQILDFLSTKIEFSHFSDRVLETSQLLYKKRTGWEDRFRNKVIFPIQNYKGEIIAFGSRVLDDSLPKYINSPETPIFKKRETLYGLYQAKESIKQNNLVYITEGYFDVIGLHQKKITQTVATLGTAITVQHIQILKKLTENLVFILDGDIAGEKAALKALFLCLAEEISPQFIICPAGKDPFDLSLEYSNQLESFFINEKKTWEDYLLYHIQKEKNPIKQQKIVKGFLYDLEKMNPFLSQSFADNVGIFFQIPINTFLNQVYTNPVRSSFKKTQSHQKYQEKFIPPIPKETSIELLLVCICLFIPNEFYQLQKKFYFSPAFFHNSQAKEFFTLFLQESAFLLSEFLQKIPIEFQVIFNSHKEAIEAMDNKQKALLDCYYSIQISSITEQEKHIKQSIPHIQEQEELLLAIQELELLSKRKIVLEQKIKNASAT